MMYLVTNSKGNTVLIHLAASLYQSLFLPIIATDVSTLLGCALFYSPKLFCLVPSYREYLKYFDDNQWNQVY